MNCHASESRGRDGRFGRIQFAFASRLGNSPRRRRQMSRHTRKVLAENLTNKTRVLRCSRRMKSRRATDHSQCSPTHPRAGMRVVAWICGAPCSVPSVRGFDALVRKLDNSELAQQVENMSDKMTNKLTAAATGCGRGVASCRRSTDTIKKMSASHLGASAHCQNNFLPRPAGSSDSDTAGLVAVCLFHPFSV